MGGIGDGETGGIRKQEAEGRKEKVISARVEHLLQ
jgi:hypothetical protein